MGLNIQIPVAELQKQKIMVGTPCYGGNMVAQTGKAMSDLASLCTNYKIGLQMYFLSNESLVPRARNYIADTFMRSDCTHLMFIDADIGFDAKDVLTMLALQISDPQKYNTLAGCYCKKTLSFEKLKVAVEKGFGDENPQDLEKYIGDFVFNPVEGTKEIRLDEPAEVLEAGTGFMMIPKATFSAFAKAYPEQYYRPDHVRTKDFDGSREIVAFFDCPIDRGYYLGDLRRIVEKLSNTSNNEEYQRLQDEAKSLLNREKTASKRYLSEDYAFNQMCRKIGLKLWILPWIKLNHTGSYVFSGSLLDLSKINVSATADAALLAKYKNNKSKP